MVIKSFEADTIQRALDQVKNEFGRDAVILKTDIIRKGDRKSFAVTAARDYEKMEAQTSLRQVTEPQAAELSAPCGTATESNGNLLEGVLLDMLFPRLLGEKERKVFLALRDDEVDADIAMNICRDLKPSDGSLLPELLRSLSSLTKSRVSFPEKKKEIVFIGPPGCGKSSVLAKLATELVFNQGRRVKLTTLDYFAPLAIDAVVVSQLNLSANSGAVINIAAGDYPPVFGVTNSRMPTGQISDFDSEKHFSKLIGELDV